VTRVRHPTWHDGPTNLPLGQIEAVGERPGYAFASSMASSSSLRISFASASTSFS